MSTNPQIEQIRLGGKLYDINVKKDWAENDPSAIGYIDNRPHYIKTVNAEEMGVEYIASHAFTNLFDLAGEASYIDRWTLPLTWVRPGHFYSLTIQVTLVTNGANTEMQAKTITCYFPKTKDEYSLCNSEQLFMDQEVFANKANKFEVYYSSSMNALWIETRQNNIKTISVAIKPYTRNIITNSAEKIYNYDSVVIESEAELGPAQDDINVATGKPFATNIFYVTYDLYQTLAADFIPVDHETIKVNSAGKLTVDHIFDTDLKISTDFGKYAAYSKVPTANKSVKDVLIDAFASDRLPMANNSEHPKVSVTFEVYDANDQKITAEDGKVPVVAVGDTVKIKPIITFDRGLYEYGTCYKGVRCSKDLHPSDIYPTSVKVTYLGESYEVAKDLTTPQGRTVVFNTYTTDKITLKEPLDLEFKVEVTFARDPNITPVTFFGRPVPENYFNDFVFWSDTDTKTTPAVALKSVYKWEWGYNEVKKESLTGLPATFETDKMQTLWVMVPPDCEKTLKIRYSAETAALPMEDESIGNSNISYTKYIVKNAEADLSKHTYYFSLEEEDN